MQELQKRNILIITYSYNYTGNTKSNYGKSTETVFKQSS
jgi:hypothetical protein